MSDDRPAAPNRLAPAVARTIRVALRRAGAVLAFERVWPSLLPAAMVVALFLIVSWFGLWQLMPWYVRAGVVAAFAVALILAVWPMLAVRLPHRSDARTRVETRSQLAHRPITALEDRLAGESPDDATRRLWDAHRQRTASGIERLSVGVPEPRTAERDPFALRAAVLLLLIVAFAWAGPDWHGRIGAAFAPLERPQAVAARIDAWVSPPTYTGRPPLLLSGGAERLNRQSATVETADADDGPVRVAQGSDLVVRASAQADLQVARIDDDGAEEALSSDNDTADAAPTEYTIRLDETAAYRVHAEGRQAFEWRFDVVADAPPSIEFTSEPDRTLSRALRLSYAVEDDYGVVSARANFEVLDDELRRRDATLVDAPEFNLTLPQMRARRGTAQTIRDLTSHPWAGAQVRVQLTARDDLEQEGVSEAVEFTLPERRFREPLARALVEQRRNLALDREARDRVALALDGLAIAPDRYIEDAAVYLGLRSAYFRTRHAREDADLIEVVDLLWDLALRVEDGELSLAAEDLRRAQEQLMDALEQGASDEEIERMMAELREALDRLMQEMARRAMSDEEFSQMPTDPDAQMLSRNELDRMLEAIEDMARSGALDQAREMLSQLREMMENLQAGRMPEGMDSGPLGESMDELADMIRRQQELMDQTHQFDQDMRSGDGREGTEERLGELGEGQADLRQALEQLMEQLAEMGIEPGDEFGDAGEAMGEAEGRLGEGRPGAATGEQSRALESLRQGGQQLADQMMQDGEGFAPGEGGQARRQTDPFGRPLRNQGPDEGRSVEVPDEIDAQRARQILEELRRRLSDPSRPRLELDYLERLLERF